MSSATRSLYFLALISLAPPVGATVPSEEAVVVAADGMAIAGAILGSNGVELPLVRPLGTGATSLDFARLGALVAKILERREVDLGERDRATILVSVLHNWQLVNRTDDERLAPFSQNLADFRSRVDFGRLVTNEARRRDFQKLFSALVLVERHREITSAEENAPLRDLFAALAYEQVRSVIFDRDYVPRPNDEELVDVLVRMKEKSGTSSGTWKPTIDLMRRELKFSLAPVTEQRAQQKEWIPAVAGAAIGEVAFFSYLLYVGESYWAAHRAEFLQIWPGIVGAPLAGAFSGIGLGFLTRPFRVSRALAKLDRFNERCEYELVHNDLSNPSQPISREP